MLNRLGIRAELVYKLSADQRKIDVRNVALIFWDENVFFQIIAEDVSKQIKTICQNVYQVIAILGIE